MSDETQQQASEDSADFGFERVTPAEKSRRVDRVFQSVAGRYDVMNDLMSGGLHRLWKRQAVAYANVRPGQRALDLASGTADMAKLLAGVVGEQGYLVASDINLAMLSRGRDALIDSGVVGNTGATLANAESLPFPTASFDRVTMAFGLRNVTHKDKALAEMRRVLRPAGCAVILEFSQLYLRRLQPLYDAYSFRALPAMGRLVAGDAESYRYLAESIRMHPGQEALKTMMEDAGLEDCTYVNLAAGVVAMHRGWVY